MVQTNLTDKELFWKSLKGEMHRADRIGNVTIMNYGNKDANIEVLYNGEKIYVATIKESGTIELNYDINYMIPRAPIYLELFEIKGCYVKAWFKYICDKEDLHVIPIVYNRPVSINRIEIQGDVYTGTR